MFWEAIKAADVGRVGVFVKQAGAADIAWEVDVCGWTAFHWAACYPSVEIMRLLCGLKKLNANRIKIAELMITRDQRP